MSKTKTIRTYTELKRFRSWDERFNYLKLFGSVGRSTFGLDRYLNQRFYTSREWRNLRSFIVTRDLGCDLAIQGLEILDRIYIHHMNPIEVEDFENDDAEMLNPEFLVCCSYKTHNAIHFGNSPSKSSLPIERKPGDTCPWL